MSNALAIAAVTAVLRDLLNDGVIDHDLSSAVGNVAVSSLPPDRITTGSSEESRLNLFLYHVSPNAAFNGTALPSFDARGTRVSNPPLALNLHYLLTAYGASEYHQEILLGYGMQLLHETPVLTRDAVRRALAPQSPVDTSTLPTAIQALSAADLADQVELVKLSPESLNTEEISRLWTAFQARYRPTAAYQASVVLIEGRKPTRAGLPVRERRLLVTPIQQPVVDRVTAEGGPMEPIVAGGRITLAGRRLRGMDTVVNVAGTEVTPAAADLGTERITIGLPPGLRAGVQGVQVIHRLPLGDPPVPHGGSASNVCAFVLRPTLVSIDPANEAADGDGLVSADVTVELDPEVGRDQRVVLFLNEIAAPDTRAPFAYSFPAPARTDLDAPATSATLVVPITGVEPGRYLVRVQVDGAESPIAVDADDQSPTFGQYTSPDVEIAA